MVMRFAPKQIHERLANEHVWFGVALTGLWTIFQSRGLRPWLFSYRPVGVGASSEGAQAIAQGVSPG